MLKEPDLAEVLHSWVEVFTRRSFLDFKRFMDDANLSPSQAGTLMRLYHCGACGVSDIGDHLGITVPAASQMVERLVQQGLLERSEDRNDRRYKQVKLSPGGKRLVENSIQARRLWMEKLTLALTPEDRRTVSGALTLLTQAARQVELEEGYGSSSGPALPCMKNNLRP